MRILVLDSFASMSEAHFSSPTIAYLRGQGHEVQIVREIIDSGALRAADAVFTEWTDQVAYDAAHIGAARRLVLRMRGFDAWGPLDKIKWENVHTLVYESDLLREIAEERLPALKQQRSIVLPSGIDLAKFSFRKRPRPEIPIVALVARAVADKGYQLAIEWARFWGPGFLQVHAATAGADQNPRFMRYLQHAAPPNFKLHGTVETAKWLDEIGATHLLSASVFESLGYNIAEGMAMGLKPLIYDSPGVRKIWPEDLIWRSLEELCDLADGCSSYEPERYRAFVEEHFDAAKLSPRFAEILLGDLAPRSVAAVVASEVVQAATSNSIALQMIVRDDAAGLERAVLSAKSQVDEIVIGVDGRSDDETWDVAQRLGTTVYKFTAADIGMTDEAWEKNALDFAAARNFGLVKVKAVWVLTLDSDEVLDASADLRKLSDTSDVFAWDMVLTINGLNHDSTRLVRRDSFNWKSDTHNYVVLRDGVEPKPSKAVIHHDVSVRSVDRQKQRNEQRDAAVMKLREEAEKGGMHQLFHLAKHLIGVGELDEALPLVDDFRKRAFPHGESADERYWLAFATANVYYVKGVLVEAEVWAIRSLLDGPHVESFCLLGDIAEERNDLQEALRWYEAANAVTVRPCRYGLQTLVDERKGRLAGIQRALASKQVTRFVPFEKPPTAQRNVPGIDLVIEHYIDSSPERQAELDECLRRNLLNPTITRVHVHGDDAALARLPSDPKIRLVPTTARATFRDLFVYASIHVSGVCAVANADIYFDETLALVPQLDGVVLCLTRWDDTPEGLVFYGVAGSQDAWIFETPCALPEADFHLGVLGCDDRVSYLLAQQQRPPWNPSLGIRAVHLHRTEKRNYTESQRLPPPYGNVSVARLVADQPLKGSLGEFTTLVRSAHPWNFVKFGDGELGCISGAVGATCDGQAYTPELRQALTQALYFLIDFPQTYIARWDGAYVEVRDQIVRQADAAPRLVDYHMFLPQDGRSVEELCMFYRAVRDEPRKILVAPARLAGAARMLEAKHVLVPEQDAFSDLQRIAHEVFKSLTDDTILLLSAGPAAKVLMHWVLRRRPDVTCIDVGSGFDALFVGQTRRGQPSQEAVRAAFVEANLL